ncbi:hypothetical protein BU23DRAFT_18950 [Bimuria novae-zelandiae CBS 107.79]|uniref:Uncharacterized protein n=1 Tax=Bimuria novae-zelandiae CBS 107.79 TaxID=1447943 RepID=A0A6A5UKG8_9PLEO|nr:hypothetical protein BU23DRAFT_18950 [Bimuria novae-zelandiae CBS 107.79]
MATNIRKIGHLTYVLRNVMRLARKELPMSFDVFHVARMSRSIFPSQCLVVCYVGRGSHFCGPANKGCVYSALPRMKVRDGTNDDGSGTNKAYQMTDLVHCHVHCHVPEGSSIAIIRCRESNLFLNMTALGYKLYGDEGKVIRMTQLSPDSWMLLRYQYDDSISKTSTRESATQHNTNWVGSIRSDTASLPPIRSRPLHLPNSLKPVLKMHPNTQSPHPHRQHTP